MTMEQLSPVMEAPPPTEQVDAAVVAEAEAIRERIEAIRQLASTQLGKEALIQAGMPEFLIQGPDEQMGNPPMTFIEHGIARIALGGF